MVKDSIRRTRFEERDRGQFDRTLLLKYRHVQGGPLRNDARHEREHEAYDAVCARLYQFLIWLLARLSLFIPENARFAHGIVTCVR